MYRRKGGEERGAEGGQGEEGHRQKGGGVCVFNNVINSS